MSRRARIVFLVLVGVQVVVPLAMAGLKEAHLAFGQTVRLKTVPVDPLDVFRGRYATLRYEISSLPSDNLAPGQTVYVPLARQGEAWTGYRAQSFRPDEEPFIRGTITAGDETSGEATIEYGIETSFVDERKADDVEELARGGDVYVEVALDDDGGAQIERLILP